MALWLAVVLVGCESRAKRHLYAAEDLFEKRDLKGARLELEQAVKDDPNLLDAHKSLAHVDEYLGDQEGAGREYEIAARLDSNDSKLLNKARYYRQLAELRNSAGKALDDIRAGKAADGLDTLKSILGSGQKSARDEAVDALHKAAPLIAERADSLYQQRKYKDAAQTYALGIRVHLMLAEATGTQRLDAATDPLMRSINRAAKAGGMPDQAFAILNDVVAFDPENKVANTELAQVYLAHKPPDYVTAADLLERAGAPDAEVKRLRSRARRR